MDSEKDDPYKTPDASLERPDVVASNPHKLEFQLVGVVITGLFLAYLGAWLAVICGFLVFADAWTAGIYKYPNKKSFLNISPMGWGMVTHLIFLIGFPLYVIARNRLKTRPGKNSYYAGVIVTGGLQSLGLIVFRFFPQVFT